MSERKGPKRLLGADLGNESADCAALVEMFNYSALGPDEGVATEEDDARVWLCLADDEYDSVEDVVILVQGVGVTDGALVRATLGDVIKYDMRGDITPPKEGESRPTITADVARRYRQMAAHLRRNAQLVDDWLLGMEVKP